MGSREPAPFGTSEVMLNQETVESNGDRVWVMKAILLGSPSDRGLINQRGALAEMFYMGNRNDFGFYGLILSVQCRRDFTAFDTVITLFREFFN